MVTVMVLKRHATNNNNKCIPNINLMVTVVASTYGDEQKIVRLCGKLF